MIIYTIYKATNKVNGKSYIGFDSKWPKRKYHHKFSYKNTKTKFYNAIKKYGWDNFEWSLMYQSKDGKYTLNVMENHFITQHDSFNNGYNMTLGGDGVLGRKPSDETKKKQSKIRIGIIFSEEHKKKLRDSARITKNFSGKKHSEESKRKMVESAKKRTNRKKLRCSCVVCHKEISNNHVSLHYQTHV
jgi:group I intron endonuclease